MREHLSGHSQPTGPCLWLLEQETPAFSPSCTSQGRATPVPGPGEARLPWVPAQPLAHTPAPATPLPLPVAPSSPTSHLRCQHRDVVELQAQSRGEAERLGLPFPGKGQQSTGVRAGVRAGVSAAGRLGSFHILPCSLLPRDFGQFTKSLSLFSHLQKRCIVHHRPPFYPGLCLLVLPNHS